MRRVERLPDRRAKVHAEQGGRLRHRIVRQTAEVVHRRAERQRQLGQRARTGKAVVFQDPYQLSRDLEETEEPREIIKAYATLHEMLLNRRETVWAGNILMAEYLPEVIKEVAARRLYNVESIHETAVVTACVSEYAALKSVDQDKITVLSIEDLILGE